MSEATVATVPVARKKITKNTVVVETKEPLKMSKKTFNVTKTAEPITFDIDGEEFEAIPSDRLPAGALATYFQHINDGNLFKAHDSFFEVVLTDDSYKRFNSRLNDKDNPITVSVLGDIAAWLLGDEYMGGKAKDEPKP
jgi:hypothetical protein